MKKILVPTDFSESSLLGIEQARRLAELSGGEVILLFVEEPVWRGGLPKDLLEVMEDYVKALHQHAQNRLQELVERDLEGVRARFEICSGHAVSAILERAQRHQVDLICMATQGWTAHLQSAPGSVTERVVRRSEVPVLVVPSHQKQQDGKG
ncbi:MAG: universal stress protein [Planctomycetota bacterium]|nr:MAG: universal stress protein [Planctomycetota bacterium]